MTDKQTDNGTDKDFGLNHFDQAGEHKNDNANTFIETESFYTDDLFVEAEQTEQPVAEEKADPFDASGGTDQFAELGYGKKEPSIPLETEAVTDVPEPESDKQQETSANKAKAPVIVAPLTDSPSTPPDDQRSGTKPITVFAILAMLVAAIAVWLNPGASSDGDEPAPLKARPVLAADVQMQRLETRMSSLEQQSSQQREELNQQIESLQQQLSTLTSQLAKRARKQQPARRASVPATKRSIPAHRPSTAPISSSANSGWVVNLASVDSKHAAAKAQGRYKARGIPTEIYTTVVKGKTWYRLRIGGFASKQEAIAQKKYLAAKHGIKDAWVQKP